MTLPRPFAIARSAMLATALLASSSVVALAQKPTNWAIDMQKSQGPIETQIQWLNHLVFYLIVAIVVFVAGLLLFTIWRFGAKRNPVANKVSHNTLLEVAWTLIPALILVVIAIPSFRLVYYEDRTHDADLTIKVTGHRWFWEYNYPDQGNIDFTSYPIPDSQLKPGQLRRLDVDNQLVVPVGKNIRVLTTGYDVIHSFFIPSLGEQRYAIPGRTIETWFRVDHPGTIYGECNQICGVNHSNMPISVQAVTPDEFKAWVVTAKTKYASDENSTPVHLASQP